VLSNVISKKEIRNEIDLLIESIPLDELKWLISIENHFIRAKDYKNNNFSYPKHKVKGVFMGCDRMMVDSLEEHIFDNEGNFKENPTLNGRSDVADYPAKIPIFYFKKYPEVPGYEYASSLFMTFMEFPTLLFKTF